MESSIPVLNISDIEACVGGHVNFTPVYIKVVAAITCFLSMVGALMIIFSYTCFKDMRTKAREILVHISVVDFTLSCANFIGIAVNFSTLLDPYQHNSANASSYLQVINGFCIAQASFSIFGGVGSILWTIALTVYLYIKIMSDNERMARHFVNVSYIVCYGIALLVTIWFGATKKLGHAPVGGSGWCSVIVEERIGSQDHFSLFFGAILWFYVTVIILPVICISLLVYLKLRVSAITHTHTHTHTLTLTCKYTHKHTHKHIW